MPKHGYKIGHHGSRDKIQMIPFDFIWGTIEYFCVFFTFSWLILQSYRIGMLFVRFFKFVVSKLFILYFFNLHADHLTVDDVMVADLLEFRLKLWSGHIVQ